MQTVVCRGRISNFNRKTNTKLLRNHLSLEVSAGADTMAECQEELIQEIVSDEDKTKSCDPCSFRGIGNPAYTYCPVCTEYLCTSCAEIHHSFKVARTHDLVQVGESTEASFKIKGLVTNVMICDIHRTENMVEYCVTHEKAICRLCKTTTHRKCDIKDLEEAAKEKKNGVKSFIEDIKLLSSDFYATNSSRQSDKSQLLETTTKIRADVQRIKEEIIIWAETLEKETLQEIEKNEKEIILNIDSDIAVTDDMINQLELVKTSLEKLHQSGNCIEALVLKAKTEQQIQEGIQLKQEIQKEISPLHCEFRKSDKLSRLMSEIPSFGTIETVDTRLIDFTDISTVTKTVDIAVDSGCITGCAFMPNGQLAICDSNHTVKVFTSDFNLKNKAKCDSRIEDIAVLSTNEIIVTKTQLMCLEVLSVSEAVGKVKSIPVGEMCWGVDVKKDNIYVSCHLNNGTGGNIKVLTLDGKSVNTFRIDEGKPYYLAVNDTGDRIIVCTDSTSKVLCMDMTGNTIFTYSDSQLDSSLGLLFDSHNNFIVCGRVSNNVHVVKQDGSKHKILLSSDDGIQEPYCLAYNSTDKTLVVGQRATKSLTAFSINM